MNKPTKPTFKNSNSSTKIVCIFSCSILKRSPRRHFSFAVLYLIDLHWHSDLGLSVSWFPRELQQ